MIFGIGFALLGVAGLVVHLTRPARAGELLAALVATRAGRVGTVLVWGWLGWHFLAR